MNTLRGFFTSFPLEVIVDKNTCYLENFTAYPTNGCLLALTFMMVLNFAVLKYLNNRKLMIYQNTDKYMQMNPFMRCLKFMSSKYFHLLLVIILYIFQAILQFIVLLFFNLKCSSTQYITSSFVYLAYLITILFFGIAFFIYDLCLNFEKLKRCDLISFWKEDIHYFRFEAYVVGILITGSIFIVYVILFYTTSDPVIYAPLNSLLYFLLFILLAGFSIFTTILRYIKNLIYPQVKSKGDLDYFLKTIDGYKIMLERCKIGK